MFVMNVYCKIARLDLTVNFHYEHFIDPINCPWVSEDGLKGTSIHKITNGPLISARNEVEQKWSIGTGSWSPPDW